MAKGWLAQTGLLIGVYAAIVAGASAVLVLANIAPDGAPPFTPGEGAWQGMVHAINSGPISRDTGWRFRTVMMVITLGGMFTTVTLTGIVTSAIGRKLQDLRRGRSVVMESGHTLILGWSPAVMTVLDELAKANAPYRRHRVVVLADRDQVLMEDEIHAAGLELGRTRVICRTGSPMRVEDLAIVSPAKAKAIVVLAPPPRPGADPDVQVIRTILALVEAPDRPTKPYHIVAEVRDPAKREVARLAGKGEVELLGPSDVIPHLMVQTSLHPGLAAVYRELFHYEGCEIYFRDAGDAVGRPFGESLSRFEDASVFGLRHADGRFTLIPPMDQVLVAGDRLITLAEGPEAFTRRAAGEAAHETDAIHLQPLPAAAPRRVMVLGWSPLGPALLRKLGDALVPGSGLRLLVPDAQAAAEAEAALATLRPLDAAVQVGDPTRRDVLEAQTPGRFDHLILLATGDAAAPEQADARTLVALIQLRALLAESGDHVTVASEILDDRHGDLAGLARDDDFFVSDTLISMMLVQVAENKELNAIFADLLDSRGADLTLQPVAHYVALGRELGLSTLLQAVAGHGEALLGYRRRTRPGGAWEVVLNPRKRERVAFGPEDQLVVLTRTIDPRRST